jgi:hypothetical protein
MPDAELSIQSRITDTSRWALASRVGQRVLGKELVSVLGIKPATMIDGLAFAEAAD